MIEITPPKLFNFAQTVTTLQRGPNDPVNHFHNNVWTRCFRLADEVTLIQTTANSRIQTEILAGDLHVEQHQALIAEALGLDDPILQNLVKDIPFSEKIESVLGLAMPGYPDIFEALIQTLMGQQVSVVVANKFRADFVEIFGGNLVYRKKPYKYFPHPQMLLSAPIAKLRSVGLSQVKSKAILQLADAFVHNPEIYSLDKNSHPDEIRRQLTSLYGVGVWTADWVLLRGFRRFEVIPDTDLAVRKAFTWWLNKPELMSSVAVKDFERKLFPYGGVIAYHVLCAYSKTHARGGDV